MCIFNDGSGTKSGNPDVADFVNALAPWVPADFKRSNFLAVRIGKDMNETSINVGNVQQILAFRFRQHPGAVVLNVCRARPGFRCVPGAPIGGCDPPHPASVATIPMIR